LAHRTTSNCLNIANDLQLKENNVIAHSPEIFIATTPQEIDFCFNAFAALRPQLKRDSFYAQVARQALQGYQILALRAQGQVLSVAGFRLVEFLAWGKVLYIDDLSSLPEARGLGYAGQLLDWLIERAKSQQCQSIHLDTGYQRHAAHRLYLRKGFELNCHHMVLGLSANA
jgi:GNAT superfamily N-acetyltransferase